MYGVCKCGEGVCCTACGATKIKARGLCESCYQQSRHRAHRDGNWQATYVDATPAAEHLVLLAAAGISRQRVIKLTGLHHTTVYRMAPGTRAHAESVAKVLAVEPPPMDLTVSDRSQAVPAIGTVRRLQGMAALGHSLYSISRETGLDYAHVCRIARGARGMVLATTAHAVADLYERWSGVPGDNDEVREEARQQGWAPPLAWAEPDDVDDPNQIDNPEARPQGIGPERRQPFTQAYKEFRSLGYNNEEVIARRLGVQYESLRAMVNRSRSLRGMSVSA